MVQWIRDNPAVQTVLTLVAGVAGAALGGLIGLPLYQITGPAILVGALALTGLPLAIAVPVRDLAFLVVGIGVGAGMNAQAREAILKWPFALLALVVMLVAIMFLCRWMLMRGFGFDRRAAVLASSPGHLSFVIAMSTALEADVARITVIQTIRVMAMTVAVPFALMLAGADLDRPVAAPDAVMGWGALAALVLATIMIAPLLRRLKVPAHFLLAGMGVSAVAHLLEWTPGAMHPGLALLGFVAIGTLIGTRFTGISLKLLGQMSVAGLCVTGVAMGMAVLFAVPVAAFLGMPVSHVVVAFAPGGLDTMIAMGGVLAADAGFVAASHVGRLVVLPVLVPLVLGRGSKPG